MNQEGLGVNEAELGHFLHQGVGSILVLQIDPIECDIYRYLLFSILISISMV